MNECICCHNRLIRHIAHRRMYWFCPSCYQEMPNLNEIKVYSLNNFSRRRENMEKNYRLF